MAQSPPRKSALVLCGPVREPVRGPAGPAVNLGAALGPRRGRHQLRDFRKVAEAAGLIAGEWTPRELRHSSVSLMSDDGMPIEHYRLAGRTESAGEPLTCKDALIAARAV